jgi:subtilisin family serine protease
VGEAGELERFPEFAEVIGPVPIDLPRTPRPYEESDEALVAAIVESEGEVFIGLKPATAVRSRVSGVVPGISRSEAMAGRADLEARGVEVLRTFRNIAAVVAFIEPEQAPQLKGLPFVDYVEPVGSVTVASLAAAPTPALPAVAPLFHEYPAQDTAWGVKQVRAPSAWNLTKGSQSFITLIDQGVDSDHVLTLGSQGGDLTYNITDCLYATPSFSSCWAGTSDENGHGSHTFGIAAARDNGVGWVGVAPLPSGGASIRVCGTISCSESGIVAALDWVTSSGKARHVVVMPLSLEGTPSSTWITAIANAYNSGALLIAAAGNTPTQSTVGYPATDTRVMAVSGTLEGDAFASSYYCDVAIGASETGGSVSGPTVEISAPFWAVSMWSHLRYNKSCGTSMAAPVVGGVAALVWTHWPSWTAGQVRSRLTATAKDLPPAGRDAQFGWGRVDAQDALFSFLANIFGHLAILNPGTYQWSASVSPVGAGTGSYSYQWAESLNGSTWWNVGTGPTYSRYVGPTHPSWHLRVTITSSGYVRTKQIYINNYSGGCNPC